MNAKKSETVSLIDELAADVQTTAQKEDALLAMLRGDVASAASVREAERAARIDDENRRYACAIDEAMQLIRAAGAKTPADLSDAMATRLFRDKLAGFRFPAFEEILPNGQPRLRPAGDRLDGLRTVDGDPKTYKASSVEWRISKIMKMLRAKTPSIAAYPWEMKPSGGYVATRGEYPQRREEAPVETIAETAVITMPKKKTAGRPSKVATKLAAAKAKQGGKNAK
jgi:hypothetical protein